MAATARPLTPAEIAALPYTLARVPLYWVAGAAWLPDPVAALIVQEPGLQFARWVLAHADVLGNLFAR